MRIVFMGTPDFAVASLDLINKSNHEIVGIITATDKPAGRGQKLRGSAVKEYAVENQLNLLQPSNLKDPEFISELASLNADLFIVVAFRMLPAVVFEMPPKGTINLHGSLLPQYRGAAPINWAIINGETETGASTFFIEQKIDTGEIIDNVKVTIEPNTTAGELHDALMHSGSTLLLDTVNSIENGTNSSTPQDNSKELKKAFKIFKDTCKINWKLEIQSIHNLIRGLSPYPASWTDINIDGQELTAKVFKSEIADLETESKTGTYTDHKNYLEFRKGKKALRILEIQIAGKKRMDIKSLLNGYKNANIQLK
jgi:methionyl-tRNA formyltransferase